MAIFQDTSCPGQTGQRVAKDKSYNWFLLFAGNKKPKSISKKSTGEEHNIMSATSDIPRFFKGRCVFVTGGTGFMGKVLVEKLLRSCPDVDNIYLLMRPKGGSDIRTRLEELIRCQVRRD